jgi:hypothetical protein
MFKKFSGSRMTRVARPAAGTMLALLLMGAVPTTTLAATAKPLDWNRLPVKTTQFGEFTSVNVDINYAKVSASRMSAGYGTSGAGVKMDSNIVTFNGATGRQIDFRLTGGKLVTDLSCNVNIGNSQAAVRLDIRVTDLGTIAVPANKVTRAEAVYLASVSCVTFFGISASVAGDLGGIEFTASGVNLSGNRYTRTDTFRGGLPVVGTAGHRYQMSVLVMAAAANTGFSQSSATLTASGFAGTASW